MQTVLQYRTCENTRHTAIRNHSSHDQQVIHDGMAGIINHLQYVFQVIFKSEPGKVKCSQYRRISTA